MIDGICIMHSAACNYMFHHFLNPHFNDRDIQQRLTAIRLKINKQQMLKKKIERDEISLYPSFAFLNPKLFKNDLHEDEATSGEKKLTAIDNLPREGVIFLSPDEDKYFFFTTTDDQSLLLRK